MGGGSWTFLWVVDRGRWVVDRGRWLVGDGGWSGMVDGSIHITRVIYMFMKCSAKVIYIYIYIYIHTDPPSE